MKPIIYQITPSPEERYLGELSPRDSIQPCDKLVKYGYNEMFDSIDLNALTSNPAWENKTKYSFSEQDPYSLTRHVKQDLGAAEFGKMMAGIWETLSTFGLTNHVSTICAPNLTELIENTCRVFRVSSGVKISSSTTKPCDLTIFVYSQSELVEQSASEIVLESLQDIMKSQTTGSSLVLQYFGIQTSISIELLYYLSSLYEESYVSRPDVFDDIQDMTMLVFTKMSATKKIPHIKAQEQRYVVSLGIENIPVSFVKRIQCFCSNIGPHRIILCVDIKTYLDKGVFDGVGLEESNQSHQKNAQRWLAAFTAPEKANQVLTKALEYSQQRCIRLELASFY